MTLSYAISLRHRLLALSLLIIISVALPAGEMTARQLHPGNVERRVGGYDAIAGVGDWLLSNGVLCAAVSGAEHETGLSLWGGALVDLGHCGRADDQLSYTHLLPQMEQRRILPIVAITAREDEDDAAIIVERSDGKLATITRFGMARAQPQRVTISTQIRRLASGPDLSLIGQLWLHPKRALTPFSVDTRGVTDAPGFAYPSFQREDRIEALQAMHYSDLTVLVGAAGEQAGISYAIHSEHSYLVDGSGKTHPVEQFTLVETDYTHQLWLVRPLWFGGKGNPGRLEMLQSLFMDLNIGETLHLKQVIYVGDEADVASATNLLYQGPWLSGSVASANGRVALFDDQLRPITEVKVDHQGHFRVRLPQGLQQCVVELTTPWGASERFEHVLTGQDQHLPVLHGNVPGRLGLPSGTPMRLVITGREGTPDPVLGAQLPHYRHGEQDVLGAAQSNTVALTGLSFDPTTVALVPGRYRVYASRGLEYAVASQDIEVVAGAQVDLFIEPLQRVLDTSGWISADFHVHSAYSFDSTLEPVQRLASFVAQGADMLVASEHDYVADLGRLASELALNRLLTVVPGVEVTGMAHTASLPGTLGHVNVYPWPRDAMAFAGGMPPHEGKRLRELIADVRARPGSPLVQLNHPRNITAQSPDLAFFDHLSIGERYDQRLPLNNVQNRSLVEASASSGLRDLDFDTYEIANGSQRKLYQLARADWLALILQGEYRPALANSDSHSLHTPVAMPRSYVAYPGPIEHPLDTQRVLNGVRAGQVFGTTGPIPEVVLRGDNGQEVGIGGSLSGKRFTLRVSARAAPWVNVNQVWVYVNGVVHQGRPYRAGEVREIPITVDRDSFIFVEFYGEPGAIYRALAPGYQPMAYTNPIWIDADGDGQWRAPGLTALPMAVSDPESLPGPLPGLE